MVKCQLGNPLGINLIFSIANHIKEINKLPQYLLGGSYNFDCYFFLAIMKGL